MKKVSILLIAILLIFQFQNIVFAYPYFDNVFVDGNKIDTFYGNCDLQKSTENLWLISIRDLCDILKFKCEYYYYSDNYSSEFTVINNYLYIENYTDNLYLNSPNGTLLKMPKVFDYSLYIPLEFISNIFGYSVEINEMQKTLSFKTTLPAQVSTLNKIISEDITLTKDKSPYYLTQNTLLDIGATMTIEKGVEIITTGGYYFQIRGNINAIGTEEEKIYFKSYSNRLWYGLQIGKSSTIKAGAVFFDNCVFSSAWCALNCFSDVAFTNCIIENNIEGIGTNSGLYYQLDSGSYGGSQGGNAGCNVNLSSCNIKNNEAGITVSTDSTFNVENCKIIENINGVGFVSNGSLNIKNSDIINNKTGISLYYYYDSMELSIDTNPIININKCNIYNSNYNFKCCSENAKITAINNYWGTTDKNEISAKIVDFYDNFNFAKVIFTPYLDQTMQEQPIPFINPYQIKNINVTDMQGNAISNIINLSRITVNLDYIKKEIFQQNANIMLGLYEKNTNKFIGLTNIISNDIIGVNNKIIVTVDLPNISKEYYIKGFIWDLINAKPLSNSINN